MATSQSSSYLDVRSFSDQLVGEAVFHANVTLALARSSRPHELLVSWPILQPGNKYSGDAH
ncbi:hypothetical protein N7471_010449 [Penicillium samsonianum]|uniref:uncharacterized protein n=1 Tax=Penicillium samsonianum TaxID=1882272 RepID=UPI002546FDC2|nr:uncharacterized protein N7471_010449 [Penicillium samsonianum]KAJ6125956.1 hypothetical protein N7471_010449 [Penicillium samsonianum]